MRTARPDGPPSIPPLAAVAHELRTPLGGILGCADLLAATPLNDEQRAHLDALREAAAALAAFAEDALDLARLGVTAPHAAVRAGPCDVRAVVGGAVRTLAPSARRHGVRLEYAVDAAVPPSVHADAGALRRVLLNLGANAVRAARGGAVHVAASVDEGGMSALVIAVSDTGRGITPDRRRTLFQPWATGDAEGGAGLGLALAGELAARMGGAITVESVPGTGSTFTIRIPS